MEGLSTALSNIDWSSLAKPAEIGLTGAGLVGNLVTQKQRADELSYLKNQQATLADPTKLAAEVASATQPLNRGLTEEVSNVVGGNLAAQGLSQAPGIQATTLAQALAPFQQQNQQTALQLVLERLGLPIQYAQAYLSGLPQNTNLAPLLALLSGQAGKNQTSPFNYWAALNAQPSAPYVNQTSGIQEPDVATNPDFPMPDVSTFETPQFAYNPTFPNLATIPPPENPSVTGDYMSSFFM